MYAGYSGRLGGLRASADGGRTWGDLGGPDLGGVYDLALTRDGRDLYAATEHGVWRLALAGGRLPRTGTGA